MFWKGIPKMANFREETLYVRLSKVKKTYYFYSFIVYQNSAFRKTAKSGALDLGLRPRYLD